MSEILRLLGGAIWFILPAYVANATPVVFGGGKTIDGGRKFTDGRPIFGAGKTWRGLIAGVAAGSAIGLIQGLIVAEPLSHLTLGFSLALGALLGDLFGSFIKRRLDLPRGGAAPGLDQLDFVVVALLLASPIHLPSLGEIAAIIAVTPALHLAMNFVGYKLGLKSRPY